MNQKEPRLYPSPPEFTHWNSVETHELIGGIELPHLTKNTEILADLVGTTVRSVTFSPGAVMIEIEGELPSVSGDHSDHQTARIRFLAPIQFGQVFLHLMREMPDFARSNRSLITPGISYRSTHKGTQSNEPDQLP